jgi:hypothetical protein
MTWSRWSPPILDHLRIANSPFFLGFDRGASSDPPPRYRIRQPAMSRRIRPFHRNGKREERTSVCTEMELCGVNPGPYLSTHLHMCNAIDPIHVHARFCIESTWFFEGIISVFQPISSSPQLRVPHLRETKETTPSLHSSPYASSCHVLARIACGSTCTPRSLKRSVKHVE